MAEVQQANLGQLKDLLWQGALQPIAHELQLAEIRQTEQRSWYWARKVIKIQKQSCQIRQGVQCVRDNSSEIVARQINVT
jgi:hypothetical protein